MIVLDINAVVSCTLNRSLAVRVSKAVSKRFNVRRPWPVSVAIVGDAAMRRLNRQYRRKDKVTDVLSFAFADEAVSVTGAVAGEIILCWPQLRRQAKAAKVSLDQEFALLLIHGLMHLLGYDHEHSAKDANLFDFTQYTILTRLGFPPHL